MKKIKKTTSKLYIDYLKLFIMNIISVIIFELSPSLITYFINLSIFIMISFLIQEKRLF